MRSTRALMLAAVLTLAFGSGSTCSPSSGEGKQLIRTAAEGKQYLDEVLRGAGLTARLADDADLAAKIAVARAEAVVKLRKIIDDATDPESGVSQACSAVGTASDVNDTLPPPPNIDDVLPQLRQHPEAISDEDAVSAVEQLQKLTGNEVFQIVDAACEGF